MHAFYEKFSPGNGGFPRSISIERVLNRVSVTVSMVWFLRDDMAHLIYDNVAISIGDDQDSMTAGTHLTRRVQVNCEPDHRHPGRSLTPHLPGTC